MKYFIFILCFLTSIAFGQVNVGVVEKIKSVSTNYTAKITDDNIMVDATSGNIVVTMPSAAAKTGKIIQVTRKDTSVNQIRVNGSLDYILVDKTQKFISDGQYWWVKEVPSSYLFASRKWQITTGCEWGPLTGSLFSDFSLDADCDNNPIEYYGEAIAEASNPGQLPQIRLSKFPKGEYLFIADAGLLTQSTSSQTAVCYYRITDGTNYIGLHGTGFRDEATATNLKNLWSVGFYGKHTNTSNLSDVVFKIQAASVTNTQCYLQSHSAGYTPALTFSIYRYAGPEFVKQKI